MVSPCRWEESPADERVGDGGIVGDFEGSESPFGAVDGQEGNVVEGGVLDHDGGVVVARALDRHLGTEAARRPVQGCPTEFCSGN